MNFKTFYTTLIALTFTIFSQAQDTEGMQGSFEKKDIPVHARRQMYGISGYFDSDKIEAKGQSFSRKDYGFDLVSGYFVANNLVLGGKFGWNVRQSIADSDDFLGEKLLYGGIFSRYYIMIGESYFALFPEVMVGYSGLTIDTQKGNGPILQAGAGITHFLSPNVGLDLVAFYEYFEAGGDLGLTFSSLGMRLGFQIYLPYEQKPDPRGYY